MILCSKRLTVGHGALHVTVTTIILGTVLLSAWGSDASPGFSSHRSLGCSRRARRARYGGGLSVLELVTVAYFLGEGGVF